MKSIKLCPFAVNTVQKCNEYKNTRTMFTLYIRSIVSSKNKLSLNNGHKKSIVVPYRAPPSGT